MRDFKQLSVWQRSHALALKIYTLTRAFPKEELFGLASQMRRAAYSVPTNIAEGCGRNSSAELKQFLVIARGSASELEYQLILSRDLGYLIETTFEDLTTELIEIRKMIYTFKRSIE